MLKTFMEPHTWKAIQQKMYVYARTKHRDQYMSELYNVEVYKVALNTIEPYMLEPYFETLYYQK